MGPIKAYGLSHRGAMAQSMQRRVGGFDTQDSRSRLVQRLPKLNKRPAPHQGGAGPKVQRLSALN